VSIYKLLLSMYMYIYIYIHENIHIYQHIYVYIHIYIYIYHIYIFVHVYVHTCSTYIHIIISYIDGYTYIHTYMHAYSEEVAKLKRAYKAKQSGMEAAARGTKFAVWSMSCCDIRDFRSGLSGRIGDPFLDFEKAMEAEHCHKEDSKAVFTSRNYGISTCAHDEWQLVVQGSTGASHNADMRHGRVIPKIEELLKLPMTTDAGLSRAEVIAVVLYTGPLYEKYNGVLRNPPKEGDDDTVSKGSTFTTTIHVLVSAVQKLASVVKLPDGLKLYRGLGGGAELPVSFFKSGENGGRGFTEWGFMSTTSDKHVAIGYSCGNADVSPPMGAMVLELTVNAVDRGACIKVHMSLYIHICTFREIHVCIHW
jgi:hypothetical protein